MQDEPAGHLLIALRLDPEVEDEVAAALFEVGCLGVQPRGVGEGAHSAARSATPWLREFDESEGDSQDAAELEAIFPLAVGEAQRSLLGRVVACLETFGDRGYVCEVGEVEVLPNRDWMQVYRETAAPIRIGRFVFDPGCAPANPPHPVPARGPQEIVFSLPARRAFGTGSHETTHLMVELLERCDLRGRTVLDVGSGSAILGLVCSALGAERIVGLELDLISNFVALDNISRNGCSVSLITGTCSCLAHSPFDVVLVNILPHRIAEERGRIRSLVAEGGTLVLSGVLESQLHENVRLWSSLGLQLVEQRMRGEWCGLELRAVGR